MLQLAPWLTLAALLAGQRVLDALAFRILALPQRCYHAPVILAGALRRPKAALLAAGLVAPPAVAAISGAARADWASLDPSGWLRVVFATAIGTIAWSTAGQSHNHYYGRWHALDRVAILLACGACWLTPLAAPVALVCCLAFVMQLNYPHGLYHSWTEKRPLYEALVLLAAAAWLGVWVHVEGWMLMVGLGAIVATAYVYPAASKLRLGRPWTWILRNRMEALTVSSAHKGWMWWWPVARVLRLTRAMGPCRAPLQAATLALELGALALLVDGRAGMAVLVGLVAMHAGIFAASGVAFWKWVILDAALAAALWRMPPELLAPAFAWSSCAIGLGAVVAARWFGHTLPLGWMDGPLVGTFVLEAQTSAGERRVVAPLTMRPYDLAFGQARFHFLIDEPQVAGSYGILCRPLDVVAVERELRASGGEPSALRAIAARHGTSKRDEKRSAAFLRGLGQYFRNRNAMIERGGLARSLSACAVTPPHIWMGARGQWLGSGEPVERLIIRWTEVFHDRNGVRVVADRPVAWIDIRSGESGTCNGSGELPAASFTGEAA